MNAAEQLKGINRNGIWQKPTPFDDNVFEQEPFPLNAFPAGIRSAIIEVQKAVQAPMEMIATCALSALSIAAQGQANVARNPVLISPVSIFTIIVAESGERKTTADGFFTDAIDTFESESREAKQPEIERYKADIQTWEAQVSGVKDAIKHAAKKGADDSTLRDKMRTLESEKPKPPKVPTVKFGDITPEELGFQLARLWPSGAIVSSEAGVIFGSHGMRADTAMRNLALHNVLWEGGEHKVSRRSQDSYHVKGARLTVSLQVQSNVIEKFMQQSGDIARGSGWLARYLIAQPRSTQGNRPYQEPNKQLPHLEAFSAKLLALLRKELPFKDDKSISLDPVTLTLDANAKTVWVDYYNLVEGMLKPMGEFVDFKDIASKSADNAARIAALFHLVEYGTEGEINQEAMYGAASLAMWYLSESRRIITELSHTGRASPAYRLEKWLIEQCKELGTNQISTRAARQSSPARNAQFDKYAAELVEKNRAMIVKDGKQIFIAINPALLEVSNELNA